MEEARTEPDERGRRPLVSVCVPVHGDPLGFEALLASLSNVDYPRASMEIVVAIDGPDSVLERIAAREYIKVVVLSRNRGSYAARNYALEVVDVASEFVLFTDADVEVSRDWVGSHLRVLATHDMSAGEVRMTMREPPTPAEQVDACRFLNQRYLVESLGYGATANLAIRRKVIEQLRFDEHLRSGGDRDFGYRARRLGFSLAYSEEAWVSHPARASVRDLLGKVRRVALGVRAMHAAGRLPGVVAAADRASALSVARANRRKYGLLWVFEVWFVDQLCNAVWVATAPRLLFRALGGRLVRLLRLT